MDIMGKRKTGNETLSPDDKAKAVTLEREKAQWQALTVREK